MLTYHKEDSDEKRQEKSCYMDYGNEHCLPCDADPDHHDVYDIF